METITVREANQHFSKYLSAVQSGASFQITKRGQVVACLTAAPASSRATHSDNLALWLDSFRFNMANRAPFDRNALYDQVV